MKLLFSAFLGFGLIAHNVILIFLAKNAESNNKLEKYIYSRFSGLEMSPTPNFYADNGRR